MNNETTKQTGSSAKRGIIISAENKVYSLGGPIPVCVRYVNGTQSDWSFREPEKTWEVKLLIVHPGGEPQEVPFGRIFSYQSGELRRKTIEPAENIKVMPGGVHEFNFDVGRRWPEVFAPRVNLLSVKDLSDDSETLLSNQIEVRVAFDESTFPQMLDIAADLKSTVDSCRFAAYWIGKLRTDFNLATGEITDRQREENRIRVSEARSWWSAHGKDAETLRRIDGLNREAGTVPR